MARWTIKGGVIVDASLIAAPASDPAPAPKEPIASADPANPVKRRGRPRKEKTDDDAI